jgi:hypothetical protein
MRGKASAEATERPSIILGSESTACLQRAKMVNSVLAKIKDLPNAAAFRGITENSNSTHGPQPFSTFRRQYRNMFNWRCEAANQNLRCYHASGYPTTQPRNAAMYSTDFKNHMLDAGHHADTALFIIINIIL